MKKILFGIFAVLLVSCSKGDYATLSGIDEPQAKTFKIPLTVESKNFNVEVEPIASASMGTLADIPFQAFVQFIVYDANDGSVYKNNAYSASQVLNATKNGKFVPDIELPVGSYHIAFLSRIEKSTIVDLVIYPKNYNTDYFPATRGDGNDIYYQIIDYTVTDSHNPEAVVTLQPMYSEITLVITDPKEFLAPLAEKLYVYTKNSSYGFYIKNKESKDEENRTLQWKYDIADIRKTNSFESRFRMSHSPNGIVEVAYLKTDEVSGELVELGTREVATFEVTDGKRYRVSGKLGDAFYPSDPSFGIHWGSIGGNILVPFN